MAARVAVTAPNSDALAVIPNPDGSINVDVLNTVQVSFVLSPLVGGKAPISVATPGATTIVAAQAGKIIRILSAYLVVGGAVNINWQSHITISDADGVQDFATNGGI